MFIAQRKEDGILVGIDEAIADKKTDYVCPICGEDVIIKNGSVMVSHFAHKSVANCDTFTADMSEWHKWWQDGFPKRNQEHVETLEISVENYRAAAMDNHFYRDSVKKLVEEREDDDMLILKHRADVRACGYVVEFQNSPISCEEFNERNWFYNAIGCKVVWVFNFIDAYSNERMECYCDTSGGGKYKWTHHSQTFIDFLPQEHKKRKEDGEFVDSDILLFFQITEAKGRGWKEDGYIEQVVWCPEDDWGSPLFNRFCTSYKITTFEELYKAIIQRKL